MTIGVGFGITMSNIEVGLIIGAAIGIGIATGISVDMAKVNKQ